MQASKNLMIPAGAWRQIQSDALNIEGFDAKSIIAKVNLAGMVASVINKILWIIALLLSFPTWGFSVLIKLLTNRVTANNDMKKPRSKRNRKLVAVRIPGAFDDVDVKKTVSDEIGKSMAGITQNFDDFIEQTINNAFDIVMLKQFSV